MNVMHDGEEELRCEMSEEVRIEAEGNPALADAIRDTFAMFRQANYSVSIGQYSSWEEAMAVLAGDRIILCEDGDEIIFTFEFDEAPQ